jgi:hypothetical protein
VTKQKSSRGNQNIERKKCRERRGVKEGGKGEGKEGGTSE